MLSGQCIQEVAYNMEDENLVLKSSCLNCDQIQCPGSSYTTDKYHLHHSCRLNGIMEMVEMPLILKGRKGLPDCITTRSLSGLVILMLFRSRSKIMVQCTMKQIQYTVSIQITLGHSEMSAEKLEQ